MACTSSGPAALLNVMYMERNFFSAAKYTINVEITTERAGIRNSLLSFFSYLVNRFVYGWI